MVPQVFNNVWFLPSENRWRDMNLLAHKDVGRLTIGDKSLGFRSKTRSVVITNVRSVSYGKQGRDFVNNWVMVEYGDPATPSTVYFADGSLLGWGGIFGGTKRILEAIRNLG